MNNLGQYIKTKRESMDLTIEDLSQMTKLSTAVILDLEEGRFENYNGEEIYVKGYLKKIGAALDLDIEGMTTTYLDLTRELRRSELQEEIEREEKEKAQIQQRNKVSLDDIKIKVPEFTKSQSVYTDNATTKYVQNGIIVLVILAIIAVCFYGVISTKDKTQDPTSFTSSTTTNVKDNTDQSDTNEDSNTTMTNDITIVRNGTLDFSITLPENTKSAVLKIEYGCRSWSTLYADEESVDSFEQRLYTKGEVVEVTLDTSTTQVFRIHNGYNLDNKYYINDVEVPQVDSITSVADVYFRITNNQTTNTINSTNITSQTTADTTDTTTDTTESVDSTQETGEVSE